ncbi:unnamed protein product [Euphydryas editha]|uniref:Zinc finger PHD-type domain-containing protein n=1 Tax=Euphydryas editha TaxID=104508 RepID=A0AAU9UP82_EUPED|nr:unnamed protein product [Euphydryas editha]
MWRAYSGLENHGYIHKRFNDSDPENPRRKTTKKEIVPSSSEGSDFSVHDDTDESPDRSQSTNARCFYCDGLFSEDMRGEQWIQCPSCTRGVHEKCAGVDNRTNYVCEYCN